MYTSSLVKILSYSGNQILLYPTLTHLKNQSKAPILLRNCNHLLYQLLFKPTFLVANNRISSNQFEKTGVYKRIWIVHPSIGRADKTDSRLSIHHIWPSNTTLSIHRHLPTPFSNFKIIAHPSLTSCNCPHMNSMYPNFLPAKRDAKIWTLSTHHDTTWCSLNYKNVRKMLSNTKEKPGETLCHILSAVEPTGLTALGNKSMQTFSKIVNAFITVPLHSCLHSLQNLQQSQEKDVVGNSSVLPAVAAG